MKKIILASSSPRRRELLKQLGLEFEVEPADIEENPEPDLQPSEFVKFLSQEKAKRVASKYPDSLIIAADTIGVLRGKIIGKPKDADDALRMLEELSGRTHKVITGLTVLDTASGEMLTRTVATDVTMRKLSKSEIEDYVRTGEPLDKAGSYAIQGLGAVLIKELKGDYYNVVGLPLSTLAESLRKFDIKVPGDPLRKKRLLRRRRSPLRKPPED